jgi:hypothetical protein
MDYGMIGKIEKANGARRNGTLCGSFFELPSAITTTIKSAS